MCVCVCVEREKRESARTHAYSIQYSSSDSSSNTSAHLAIMSNEHGLEVVVLVYVLCFYYSFRFVEDD